MYGLYDVRRVLDIWRSKAVCNFSFTLFKTRELTQYLFHKHGLNETFCLLVRSFVHIGTHVRERQRQRSSPRKCSRNYVSLISCATITIYHIFVDTPKVCKQWVYYWVRAIIFEVWTICQFDEVSFYARIADSWNPNTVIACSWNWFQSSPSFFSYRCQREQKYKPNSLLPLAIMVILIVTIVEDDI